MTRLLALKVELVCDVPTGDLPEMEAAIREAQEIERQIVSRLRRVAMGKRWTLVVDGTNDPARVLLKGQEMPDESR